MSCSTNIHTACLALWQSSTMPDGEELEDIKTSISQDRFLDYSSSKTSSLQKATIFFTRVPHSLSTATYYVSTQSSPRMGSVSYRDGIAILQLIVFPFIFATSIFIWRKSGWRIGSRIWRYPATLSLIRIAGSICTLLTITNKSRNVLIGAYVCELIGIAPLLLTFIGVLRQM